MISRGGRIHRILRYAGLFPSLFSFENGGDKTTRETGHQVPLSPEATSPVALLSLLSSPGDHVPIAAVLRLLRGHMVHGFETAGYLRWHSIEKTKDRLDRRKVL